VLVARCIRRHRPGDGGVREGRNDDENRLGSRYSLVHVRGNAGGSSKTAGKSCGWQSAEADDAVAVDWLNVALEIGGLVQGNLESAQREVRNGSKRAVS
jgi:hypothetical protein